MKESNQSNQGNHEQGSGISTIIIAVIVACIMLIMHPLFSVLRKGLCWVGRKALAKWHARKQQTAETVKKKELRTPEIFKGMSNLAPARDIDWAAMRKLK